MLTSALVTIASINFDRIVDFYTQFLEIAPDRSIPNVYAEFSIAGLKLGIFCPHPSNRQEFGHPQQSGMSMCLEVESLEDSIDKLAKLGYAPPGQITTASHGREIYAYDPDGNRLILHQAA
ncbi:VOC family protein [Chamaesiphon polymorphus]|uniref:Glyoxalase n=1 Tax=Chamaesiphon polymorphus CCALA 037 TaxID=2107692 RepID=A0A2T1GBL6_9CYAN|nr:VOC family protein [Chamaesiphon polymorphus]PSB54726.1 glyoxalase [Chamaesiphon polymorphus CCALA 037]